MATEWDLLESLQTTDVSGAIPKEIIADLIEQSRVQNIMYAAVPRRKVSTTQIFWNTRTQIPQGGASAQAPSPTGATSVPAQNSKFTNNNNQFVRHLTYKGDVGTIAEQVATVNGSRLEIEMRGQAESEARDETIYTLYGCESATFNNKRTQWSGFDLLVAKQNKLKWSAAPTLALLDGLIDLVRAAYGLTNLGGHFAFFMSPYMQSAINQLFSGTYRTNLPPVELRPSIDPGMFGEQNRAWFAKRIEAMEGIEVSSYRGIPIVDTGFIAAAGQMGTVTIGAGVPTGTTFTATAQYYRVEAVTQLGKSLASAEVSFTPTAGGSIALSWSTPAITDANGNTYPIYCYRIFRGTAAGAETLYAVVAAYAADSAQPYDTPITSWTDTNAAFDPLHDGTTGNALVYSAPDAVTVPNLAKAEDLFLFPLDWQIGHLAVLNEIKQEMLAVVEARSRQFETTADMAYTMLSNKYCAQATGVTHP
jgi:hypothetical protein